MKNKLLLLVLMNFTVLIAKGQVEPTLPSPCDYLGPANKNNMSISGSTVFTFATLADFNTSVGSNGITVTVQSPNPYKLYIAGTITSPIGSSTNTIIPINTFTVSATNPGTISPTTITLSNSYLPVAQGAGLSGNTTRAHVLTITRNALNTFTQEPGTHTLTLHIRYCQ